MIMAEDYPQLINAPNIGFKALGDYSMLQSHRMLPLYSFELHKLVASMPVLLVKTGDNWFLRGAMAFRQGPNLLIGPRGGWQSTVLPEALKVLPLGLGTGPDGAPALRAMAPSPRLEEGVGNILIDENGERTRHYGHYLQILERQQEDMQLVGRHAQALFDAACLKPMDPEGAFAVGNGQVYITTLKLLQALPGETLAGLAGSGALALAHAILFSAGNITRFKAMLKRHRGQGGRRQDQPEAFLQEEAEVSFNFDKI
jgi:hypothetical protein